MTNKLSASLRLMMTAEPKEAEITYKDRNQEERTRVRESLEAYLLGSGTPMTLIDININKFHNGSQYRNVKLTDLFKTFVKNEDDLKTGKKVLLAHVELLPVKNSFSETGVINRFEPYLTGFDIAEATAEDTSEIEVIRKVIG